MAIQNPFSITYGNGSSLGTVVGGNLEYYQLNGPYVIDKGFETFRLVFDVVVLADTAITLKTYADALETNFSKRDQNVVIDLDKANSAANNRWTYVSGTDIVNVRSQITKSGNPDTDRGFSRAYTIVITSELVEGTTGLREFDVNVDFEAGRQRVVTMRGMYTRQGSNSAAAQYIAHWPNEAATILAAIPPTSPTAAWELVDENYTKDRSDVTCTFHQQYVELLADQKDGTTDDDEIADHRIVFTDLSQFPGDGRQDLTRLRRVIGTYDCAIDIVEYSSRDLQAKFDADIRPQVVALFSSNLSPTTFCVEDQRVSYDETSKRLQATIQFLYRKEEDTEDVVEISQSVAFRESRHIDFTPTHKGIELYGLVNVGWSTLERIMTRTVIVVGDENPKLRIAQAPTLNLAGGFGKIAGQELEEPKGGAKREVKVGDWNIVSATSQVSNQWVGAKKKDAGDGAAEPIKLSVLTETVIERFAMPATGTIPKLQNKGED